MTATADYSTESVLLCDVDGVVLDSYRSHLRATAGLLTLMGDDRPLASRDDERRRFSMATLSERYDPHVASALISARPALMAATIESTPIVKGVIEALTSVSLPTILVTAGYAAAVRERLGNQVRHFVGVLGCETGPKADLLGSFASAARGYVCDTVSDVRKCRGLGIRAIGVTWGFDSRVELLESGAYRVIDEPTDLLDLVRGGL